MNNSKKIKRNLELKSQLKKHVEHKEETTLLELINAFLEESGLMSSNKIDRAKKKLGKLNNLRDKEYGKKVLSERKLNVKHSKLKKSKEVKAIDERKELYSKYLKSKEWKKIRNLVFLQMGKKCCRCNENKTLEIHHITYKNIFKEKIEDLEVVCKPCHVKIHRKELPFTKPKTS